MILTTPQYIHLITALEAAETNYVAHRSSDGHALVTINDEAQSLQSLKRIVDNEVGEGFLTFLPAQQTRTIKTYILDVPHDVTVEFTQDQYGDITIHRTMLADSMELLGWSRKIEAAVMVELVKVLDNENK